MRSSSASSSTISRPWKARHDLGGQVVGGRPQAAAGDDQVDALAGQEAQRAPRCPPGGRRRRPCARGRRPSSSRRSDSHGPLRSATRPVSTSVPVTTMPARALTRPAASAGTRAGSVLTFGRGDLVADAVGRPAARCACLPLIDRRASPLPSSSRRCVERYGPLRPPEVRITPLTGVRPPAAFRHT